MNSSHINLTHKMFITYVWLNRWKMMRFHLLIFPFVGITNHINGYLTLRKRDRTKTLLKRHLGIQKIVLWNWCMMICKEVLDFHLGVSSTPRSIFYKTQDQKIKITFYGITSVNLQWQRKHNENHDILDFFRYKTHLFIW